MTRQIHVTDHAIDRAMERRGHTLFEGLTRMQVRDVIHREVADAFHHNRTSRALPKWLRLIGTRKTDAFVRGKPGRKIVWDAQHQLGWVVNRDERAELDVVVTTLHRTKGVSHEARARLDDPASGRAVDSASL